MKAKVGKAAVSAKVQSKSAKTVAVAAQVKKAVARPVGTSSKQSLPKRSVKPTVKPASKPEIKASGDSRAKPAAKAASKSAGFAGAKLGVKVTHSAVSKVAAKTPVKSGIGVKPGAFKASSKTAVTIKNQKSAPKVVAKKVNPVLKNTPKPVAQPVVKSAATKVAKVGKELKIGVAKPTALPPPKGQPGSKTSATVGAIKKPVVQPVIKSALKNGMTPTAQTTSQTIAQTTAPTAQKPTVPAAALPVGSAAPVPPKAGRPSSRLAQLTVPSMAQSVASTAAKSSFTQFTTSPLIVPPLPSATKKDPKLANNWKTKPVEQLTDAELLAMPDSEYMNEKQMAVFRLKLSILKQDILNSASDTTEHLREDTVVVPDPADRATIEEEHALELRTRDRERKLLKKIEQSINSIDAGDYGYCDETGEPIGVGRLLARPTATLSLEAQQRRELKQKMFGD